MRKIPLKSVSDGMILAQPLFAANGNVLMDKGLALKASLVPRLASWGVNIVYVEGEAEEKEEKPILLANALSTPLEMLFEGKNTNDAMATIFSALVNFRDKNERN